MKELGLIGEPSRPQMTKFLLAGRSIALPDGTLCASHLLMMELDLTGKA